MVFRSFTTANKEMCGLIENAMCPVMPAYEMDTVPDPQTVISRGQSQTFTTISNLRDNTDYYWKVVARIAGKSNSGPVWTFKTKKNPETNTIPSAPTR